HSRFAGPPDPPSTRQTDPSWPPRACPTRREVESITPEPSNTPPVSSKFEVHDSRTDRRWCRTRADLGALQAVSRQDRELIVTPVCLSAPMASPAFTLCNCCESRSCQLAMERPGRPEGRPAT